MFGESIKWLKMRRRPLLLWQHHSRRCRSRRGRLLRCRTRQCRSRRGHLLWYRSWDLLRGMLQLKRNETYTVAAAVDNATVEEDWVVYCGVIYCGARVALLRYHSLLLQLPFQSEFWCNLSPFIRPPGKIPSKNELNGLNFKIALSNNKRNENITLNLEMYFPDRPSCHEVVCVHECTLKTKFLFVLTTYLGIRPDKDWIHFERYVAVS